MSDTKRAIAQPDSIVTDALIAIEQLDQSRRETCQEHNDRIRKLRALVRSILGRRIEAHGELFDIEPLLEPEVLRLMKQPTTGL